MTKAEAKRDIVDRAIDNVGGRRAWARMSRDQQVTEVEAALWRHIRCSIGIAESVSTADMRTVWRAAFAAAGFED